ncbi:MAG: corrinoid protein [Candidatus Omnitrophota bacterium]
MDVLKNLLFEGDAEGLSAEVKRLITSGTSPEEILNEGLIAAMGVIGEKFRNNEIFIPEVLISADAMHAGMSILEPYLAEAGVQPVGKVIIGTVKGDLHDIGKNLVMMMLKGAGFQIEDCGIDVAPEKFVEKVRDSGASILAMSSLITTSMGAMKLTLEALKASGLRDKVKVMIGGAPITEGFAREIGADGYGSSAAEAVDIAKDFLGLKVS